MDERASAEPPTGKDEAGAWAGGADERASAEAAGEDEGGSAGGLEGASDSGGGGGDDDGGGGGGGGGGRVSSGWEGGGFGGGGEGEGGGGDGEGGGGDGGGGRGQVRAVHTQMELYEQPSSLQFWSHSWYPRREQRRLASAHVVGSNELRPHWPAMQSLFLLLGPRRRHVAPSQHCAAMAVPSSVVAAGSWTHPTWLELPSITRTPCDGKVVGATGVGGEGGGGGDGTGGGGGGGCGGGGGGGSSGGGGGGGG